MYLARTVTPADGIQTVFPVSFPYQDEADVEVYVYTDPTSPGAPVTSGWTWASAGTIVFAPAPTSGKTVDVRRASKITAMDNVFSGGALSSSRITENDTQLLYLVQEIQDDLVDDSTQLATIWGKLSSVAKGDPGGNVMAIGPKAIANTLAIPVGTNVVRTTGYTSDGDKGGAFYVYDAAVNAAYVAANPRTSFLSSNARGFRLSGNPVLKPHMVGVVGDKVADDTASIQAFSDFVFNNGPTDALIDFTAQCLITAEVHVGPNANQNFNTIRWNLTGDLELYASGAFFEACEIRNLGAAIWSGRVSVYGNGTDNAVLWANRTIWNGIKLTNCQLAVFGGFRAYNCALWGVYAPTTGGSSDEAGWGTVRCYYCGSGYSLNGYSFTSNWSSPVHTPLAYDSTTQRDTITLDALPSAQLLTNEALGAQPVFVRIGTTWHYVYAWDQTAKTITVYPTIDSTSFTAAAGTLRWAFGGAFGDFGADSWWNGNHLHAVTCGMGLVVACGYGPQINSCDITACGIGIVVGASPTTSSLGTHISDCYLEGNDTAILGISPRSAFPALYIDCITDDLDMSKVFAMAPRRNNDKFFGDTFGNTGFRQGYAVIGCNGRVFTFDGANWDAPVTGNTNFFDHAKPAAPPYVQWLNTQTVTLTAVGSGEYNRLWGLTGRTWLYIGTGQNGAPTGTFTFVPVAGGTINGGAVNANAVFSGFTGPVGFDIRVKSDDQLTWEVRPVYGWHLNATAIYDPPSLATGASSPIQTVALTGAVLGNVIAASFSADLAGARITAWVSAAGVVSYYFTNEAGTNPLNLASGTVTVAKVG